MENSTKILIGITLLGGAYYLYTRKKPEAVIVNTGGVKNSLTGCKNIQTIPCLKAPCPKRCADNDLPQKGGSPSVGTAVVFDCEKAKVEHKQIYEGVKRMMEKFTHFSEKQKNDSICNEMRNAILFKDYSLSK
jgi:hypothetical protein